MQRGARCFLLPQTCKSEFVEAFKNINLGIFRKNKKKTIFKSESELVSPLINCNQQAALPPVSLKGSSYSSSYLFSYLIIIFRVIIKTLATATGKLSFCVGQRAAQENDSFEAVTALTAPA